MKTTSIATPPDPTEAEIQHTAYLLWLENGQPEGRDQEHWFAAKELLKHHHARASGRKRQPASTVPPPVPVSSPKGN
jgi:hypothetical protein